MPAPPRRPSRGWDYFLPRPRLLFEPLSVEVEPLVKVVDAPPLLPAASKAVAVTVCVPLLTLRRFQLQDALEVPEHSNLPSPRMSIRVTALLSVA